MYTITDMTKPLYLTTGKYYGQIMLCPPDDTLISSFGMIIIYSSKYDTWRGLNQATLTSDVALETNEADTICRQLGYTGARPGSAVTKQAVYNNFEQCR